MTTIYGGPPLGGQNNMTVQGCFHALVTYGSGPAKLMAADALKLYAQRQGNMITTEQMHTQVQTLLNQVNTVDPANQDMLGWALTELRQL